jgi:hypothetical protein
MCLSCLQAHSLPTGFGTAMATVDLDRPRLTAAEMEARIVRYGDLRPCKTAFIDAHTPGSDRRRTSPSSAAG